MHLVDFYDTESKKRQLTEEEKAFIRKKIPKKKTRLRYGIWKPIQRNGCQIVLMVEFNIHVGRRPGVDNSIEFIADVPLSDLEYEEEVANFGCNNRTYTQYKYSTIEQVIREDLKCGYKTPEKFINECRKRGLSEALNLFSELEIE